MEEKNATIQWFVHEGMMARVERIFRLTVIALVVALAISVAALVVNDCKWRESYEALSQQYAELVEETDGVQQQPNGGAN